MMRAATRVGRWRFLRPLLAPGPDDGRPEPGVWPAPAAAALRTIRADVLLILVSAVAVRLWFIFAWRTDSDEPQHLHAAWAWSQGLVQYRDVFDNHFPLLHLLFAPLLRVVPEDSSVFVAARLAILPFAAACAWLVYLIALRFVSRPVALLTAVGFNALPPWLPKSVEFRNDTLWVFFWLAGVALLVCGRRPRWMSAGVALGLSLLASIKAVPLFLAHAAAFALVRRSTAPVNVLRLAAGGAIPLLAVVLLMSALGALEAMIYDTLLFNAATPVSAARRAGGVLAFAAAVPLMAWKAPPFARQRSAAAVHAWLFGISFALLLLCFWPILTPRDFLPLAPLGSLAAATRLPRRRPLVTAAALLIAAVLSSVCYARLWKPADRSRERFVDAVVALTRPGDFVFDLKGESVFRRRAVSVIYEDVGRALTANGVLADQGPEAIVAHGCCAAVADSTHIPPRTRAFLNRHFVPAGLLRVCGTVVRDGTFEIAVPQVYAIVTPRPGRLLIDGNPYNRPLRLARGRHSLSGPGAENAIVVWWRAAKEVPRARHDDTIPPEGLRSP